MTEMSNMEEFKLLDNLFSFPSELFDIKIVQF